MTNLSNAIAGEFISGSESVTVTEKGARLAALFIKANEGMTEALEGETTWVDMQAVLLEAIRQIPERDDREALAASYRKAQQRERERMAYIATRLRSGADPMIVGESFEDAMMRLRRFKWLTDTMSVSLKTAKMDKLAVEFKEIATYIPALPDNTGKTPAGDTGETPADDAGETQQKREWSTLARDRIIKRALWYRKESNKLSGIVAKQGQTILRRDDTIAALQARVNELEGQIRALTKRTRKTGTGTK